MVNGGEYNELIYVRRNVKKISTRTNTFEKIDFQLHIRGYEGLDTREDVCVDPDIHDPSGSKYLSKSWLFWSRKIHWRSHCGSTSYELFTFRWWTQELYWYAKIANFYILIGLKFLSNFLKRWHLDGEFVSSWREFLSKSLTCLNKHFPTKKIYFTLNNVRVQWR